MVLLAVYVLMCGVMAIVLLGGAVVEIARSCFSSFRPGKQKLETNDDRATEVKQEVCNG